MAERPRTISSHVISTRFRGTATLFSLPSLEIARARDTVEDSTGSGKYGLGRRKTRQIVSFGGRISQLVRRCEGRACHC